MAVAYNDVMSDLQQLLVRLEDAEAQAERHIAEMDAQATTYRTAICALQVEISVIAAVLRMLVNAMAENLREQPGDAALIPSEVR